jgi:hypothetical protein
MAESVSYAVSSRETNIIQGAFRPEGWYWSRLIRHMIRILPCFIHFIIYLKRRVYRVFIISYISTMPLIIHVFYENFEFFLKNLKFFDFLNIFFNFENWWKFWIFFGNLKFFKFGIFFLENFEILKLFAMFYTLSYI